MDQSNKLPPENFEKAIVHAEKNDWRLWLIGTGVLLCVATGFICLLAPTLLAGARGGLYPLPQLTGGFAVLVLLFVAYLLDQRRRLSLLRRDLVGQMLNEFTLVQQALDPATHTCTLAYLEKLLPRELLRAQRTGEPFCLVTVNIESVSTINRMHGPLAGDHLTMVLARQMRNTFRGADILCRSGRDEFVLLLPETTRELASRALVRLEAAVEQWNNATASPYKLHINHAILEYAKGVDIWAELMNLRSHRRQMPIEETARVPSADSHYLM
jgi:diguanylate cyclase (GGDEF)-like protein